MTGRNLAVHVGIACGALLLGVPDWAASQSVSESSALDEIIVTARKREEKLQDVPDSISAITASEIEERRVQNIADANSLVPNFHVLRDQDPANNIISVRGIGSGRLLAPAIAFAVDGVILPDSDAFMTDLTDVESIEVLRGPQGGLYGRNAIAGVVNVTTKRPTDVLSGDFRLSYANGNTSDAFAAVGGPILGSNLVGRLSAGFHNTDGLITNQFDGRKLDNDRRYFLATRLMFEPTDDFKLDLRASYHDEDSGAGVLSSHDVLGTTGGTITESLAGIEPDLNEPSRSTYRMTDVALVADWNTKKGTLTSITAYDDINVFFHGDLDTVPLQVATSTQSRSTRGVSQELRFTSPTDQRLRYIAGLYYQQTDRDIHTIVGLDYCFLLPLPFCPTPPGTVSSLTFADAAVTSGHFKQSAVFGQANYDITRTLELTLALRHDRDDRSQLDHLTLRTDDATFSKTQPKVSLGWKISPDFLLYGTFAEGYKSGGFNPPPPAGASFGLVVQQEGTKAYETGIKSSWLDNRLRANLALFYTDYDNPQISRLDLQTGGNVVVNGRKARIRGTEVELVAKPLPRWELHGSVGYIDARLTDFDGTGQFDNNHLPNSPEYTVNIGTRYGQPVNATINAVARLDFNRAGREYFSEDNLINQPAYDTVDLQFGLESARWSATLFGRNIFSTRYVTSAFSRNISPLLFGPLNIDPYYTAVGAQYGVEFKYRF